MGIRVAIIGLDAATFDVILPLVERGDLPNLGRLMASGTWGVLRSTYPPVSVPAWVSCITGKGPGKHGLLDFHHYDAQNYSGRGKLVNSADFAGSTLFDILSRREKRVGAFRIPLTYPPWPVNGFMISGQPTPDRCRAYTYPSELAEEVGNLHMESNLKEFQYLEDEIYLKNILWDTERHIEAAVNLLRHHGRDLDFFMMVLNALDAVQHRFWKYMDKDYPFSEIDRASKYKEVINDLYRIVDEGVGRVLKHLPPEALILVVSDHGARLRPYRMVHLNRWLYSKKFLTFKSGEDSPTIDWIWTKAYRFPMYPPLDGIEINLAGRQTEGCIKTESEYERVRLNILEEIEEIRDPETGLQIVQKAWKKEDIYSGRYLHRIPDIVVLLNDGYEGGGALSGPFVTLKKREDYNIWNGFHSMEGILIASGPDVPSGRSIKGAEIGDIAPTILYAMGESIPESMDGKVLFDLFDENYILCNKVQYTRNEENEAMEEKYELSENEEAEMKKKLRVLGYIE